MAKEYSREATTAEKLFWDTLVQNVKNSTSKRILIKVEQLEQKVEDVRDAAKKSGSILKTWANMIKQGAKDLRE
jgi:hypothetical protein